MSEEGPNSLIRGRKCGTTTGSVSGRSSQAAFTRRASASAAVALSAMILLAMDRAALAHGESPTWKCARHIRNVMSVGTSIS